MSDKKYKLKLVELDHRGSEINTLFELSLTNDEFWKLVLEMVKVRLTMKLD